MRPEDEAILRAVRSRTVGVLAEVVGTGVPVAMLDVPNLRNVGDSMIWAGQRAYVRELGLDVVHTAGIASYDAAALRRKLPPDGVILLRGGGNFGDIWRGHQRHREQVSRDFRDRRIVQLSQSVWFGAPKAAANADRILGNHPDFTLLVRDLDSQQRAAEQVPSVRTVHCPDMALGWTPRVRRAGAGTAPVLVLARRDHEGVSGLADRAAGLGGAEVLDWTSDRLDSPRRRLAATAPRVAARHPALGAGRIGRSLVARGLVGVNEANLRSAERLFAGRRLVVVDRLHAHVLAALLGIDHVVLDNSYGKIGAVVREYTGAFSTTTYTHDVDEALERVRTGLGTDGRG
ncbi:polysaccharide pyruvyl transferase family protein [Cellulomonas composti]|uniref:Exopolysaccharide biosynthesis protein n=1 Tax=Cellulomonas composti TaxID=266130 RepID=A0A511J8X1_9CELL|nr:polysaccharide pyruvyl transferase family protein [Cellulomonas composti]GEL94448.1 exopolysaccharide biosynthesis protein [Cellulomonas composti]